jgi:hypothetical protein
MQLAGAIVHSLDVEAPSNSSPIRVRRPSTRNSINVTPRSPSAAASAYCVLRMTLAYIAELDTELIARIRAGEEGEAGRDSDAAALVEHRLAAIPAKSALERGAIVDSAVTIYSRSKPVRLDAADALLLSRAKTTNDRIERLKTYSTMLLASNNVEDSFYSTRAAKLIMGIADSLTVAERQSDERQLQTRLQDNDYWLREARPGTIAAVGTTVYGAELLRVRVAERPQVRTIANDGLLSYE